MAIPRISAHRPGGSLLSLDFSIAPSTSLIPTPIVSFPDRSCKSVKTLRISCPWKLLRSLKTAPSSCGVFTFGTGISPSKTRKKSSCCSVDLADVVPRTSLCLPFGGGFLIKLLRAERTVLLKRGPIGTQSRRPSISSMTTMDCGD